MKTVIRLRDAEGTGASQSFSEAPVARLEESCPKGPWTGQHPAVGTTDVAHDPCLGTPQAAHLPAAAHQNPAPHPLDRPTQP